MKASGANVGTMSFLERRSRGISAILGSSADVMWHGLALGVDFEWRTILTAGLLSPIS